MMLRPSTSTSYSSSFGSLRMAPIVESGRFVWSDLRMAPSSAAARRGNASAAARMDFMRQGSFDSEGGGGTARSLAGQPRDEERVLVDDELQTRPEHNHGLEKAAPV